MINIRFINPEDTYLIRQQVLRPTQKIEECQYELDKKEQTFHIGAYEKDNLVSIASFYNETHPNWAYQNVYRLRGMATLLEYRGKGAGKSLILFAEKELMNRRAELWWCNARTSASSYYEKLGLKQQGEIFDIPPIGPHKVMYKKLM